MELHEMLVDIVIVAPVAAVSQQRCRLIGLLLLVIASPMA